MNVSEHFDVTYPKLRAVAEKLLRQQPSQNTLQATALVHEVYLRVANMDADVIKDDEHFMAIAASAMHQILIDGARRRKARKRGGEDKSSAEQDLLISSRGTTCDVLVIHDLISRLGQLDSRQARIVEMRIFGGMTVPEIAEALGVSIATVEKDWRQARAWMRVQMDGALG